MANVDKFRDAAGILQQVDVSNILTSMALGIAEAQSQLDDNSIKQLLILADPDNGVNGVSLIEMGFTPAFYHFQYADLSASVSLQMSQTSSFSLDVSIEAEFGGQGGFTKDNYDFLTSTRDEDTRKEFKSSRDVVMSSKESKSLTIANTSVAMNQSEGGWTKVNNFEREIRDINLYRVERAAKDEQQQFRILENNTVAMRYEAGFLSFKLPIAIAKHHGVLRIDSYGATGGEGVDIDNSTPAGPTGGNFDIADNITDTYTNAWTANNGIPGGKVIAFTEGGYMSGGSTAVTPIKVYFKFDKHDIVWGYKGNQDHSDAIMALSKVLKADPNLKIEVMGHTDGKGPDGYNIKLSQRRINALIAELKRDLCSDTQFAPQTPQGELNAPQDTEKWDERWAEVVFSAGTDYIYFQEGVFQGDKITPALNVPTTDGNEFILAETTTGTNANRHVHAVIAGATLDLDVTSLTDIQSALSSASTNSALSIEESDQSLYVLRDEATFRFTVYSKDDESLNIDDSSSSSEDITSEESSFLISKIESQESRTKREIDKREGSNTFALAGSVDVRASRAFSMSVNGNASMSARLVSLPAPPEFLDQIKDFFN